MSVWCELSLVEKIVVVLALFNRPLSVYQLGVVIVLLNRILCDEAKSLNLNLTQLDTGGVSYES